MTLLLPSLFVWRGTNCIHCSMRVAYGWLKLLLWMASIKLSYCSS